MDSWRARVKAFWKNKKWERTNDLAGYKPKFTLLCRFCKDGGKRVPMVFRYCFLFTPEDKAGRVMYSFEGSGAQIAYKCPKCGYHTRFNIIDYDDYIEKIWAKRVEKNFGVLWYPSVDDWGKDEEIKRQLMGLGYFGGR